MTKDAENFARLLRHALPAGLPPQVAAGPGEGPHAYRAFDASRAVRGVLAHFPSPWRGLAGAVLWCPDLSPERVWRLGDALGGVRLLGGGMSLLEVQLPRDEDALASGKQLELEVTDVYVAGGTNMARAPLRDRLGRLPLSESGPSAAPRATLRPCRYDERPPEDQRWARVAVREGVGPTETRDARVCVVRALCDERGQGCVLDDRGQPVPFVLESEGEGRSPHALFEFVPACGRWRRLSACAGPAMGVGEAVERLARVAVS